MKTIQGRYWIFSGFLAMGLLSFFVTQGLVRASLSELETESSLAYAAWSILGLIKGLGLSFFAMIVVAFFGYVVSKFWFRNREAQLGFKMTTIFLGLLAIAIALLWQAS